MGCLNTLGGKCFTKTIFFFLNMFLFIVGAGTIVVSTMLIHFGNEFDVLLFKGFIKLPICALIDAMFMLLLLITFLGFDRIMKKNTWMLNAYALIVLVLVIAQIALGILIFTKRDKTNTPLADSMEDAMSRYGSGDKYLDESIDIALHELKCCGLVSYTDWKNFTYDGVADGCCETMIDDCGWKYFDTINPPTIWQKGCYTLIYDDVMFYDSWLGGLVIVLAIVQLICVLCAYGIIRKSR